MSHIVPIPADRHDSALAPVKTVQAWKTSKNVQAGHAVHARTASAPVVLNRGENTFDSMFAEAQPAPRGFEAAMAEADRNAAQETQGAFEFEDVIDIINPLHHLPVVGMVYRSLTGDTIKPMASIIGGGIFGGPMGAASGVVNAVVQEETGKDIAGNVFAIVRGEETEDGQNTLFAESDLQDDPETQLAFAAQMHGLETGEQLGTKLNQDLPGTAMSFADTQQAARAYEKASMADGRTAGWYWGEKAAASTASQSFDARALVASALPAREPITTLSLSDLPPIY